MRSKRSPDLARTPWECRGLRVGEGAGASLHVFLLADPRSGVSPRRFRAIACVDNFFCDYVHGGDSNTLVARCTQGEHSVVPTLVKAPVIIVTPLNHCDFSCHIRELQKRCNGGTLYSSCQEKKSRGLVYYPTLPIIKYNEQPNNKIP